MSTPENALRRTPFFEDHVALGARRAPFAGYDMPVQYSGIMDEHKAVREAAGLFDVAHMGVATVEGAGAFEFLNESLTRDLSKTVPGKAAYTLLCHDSGGTVDDLIVYRRRPDLFYLVLNASNKDKDMARLRELARGRSDVKLTGPIDDIALLALQGPKSEAVLAAAGFKKDAATLVTNQPERTLPEAFSFFKAEIAGIPVDVATTGYTGERGCELFVANKNARALWAALMKAGAPLGLKPCGLGARDTLRTEMGYSLYGHELLDTINAVEAGLSWAVGFDKPKFTGHEALRAAKAKPARKLVALKNSSKQAPRAGMKVIDRATGAEVGEITSGTLAPSLGYVIGLALVRADATGPYDIDIRGTRVPYETTKRPFYQPPKETPHV